MGVYQERFGRVHRAAQQVGDFRNRQAVDIAQGQRGAVMPTEMLEHGRGTQPVGMELEAVVELVGLGRNLGEESFVTAPAPPVVDEFVPGDTDEPRHRHVTGRGAATAAKNVSEVRSSAVATSPQRSRR